MSGPSIVIIAGCQSRSRRIGLEQWTSLVSSWRRDRYFLIAASSEDGAFADQLAQGFPGEASRFRGSFAELCETIAGAEEVLTLDGGPVHIASFFGVRTTAVFTSGRFRKWAPLGEDSYVIRRHDLPCQPCTIFGQVPPCPNEFACTALKSSATGRERVDAIFKAGRLSL